MSSGFIADADGHVLSSAHVVFDARQTVSGVPLPRAFPWQS